MEIKRVFRPKNTTLEDNHILSAVSRGVQSAMRWDDVRAQLKTDGWQFLGSGVSRIALYHDLMDVVVKVPRYRDGGYDRFGMHLNFTEFRNNMYLTACGHGELVPRTVGVIETVGPHFYQLQEYVDGEQWLEQTRRSMRMDDLHEIFDEVFGVGNAYDLHDQNIRWVNRVGDLYDPVVLDTGWEVSYLHPFREADYFLSD